MRNTYEIENGSMNNNVVLLNEFLLMQKQIKNQVTNRHSELQKQIDE